MSDMTPKKALIVVVFNVNQTFIVFFNLGSSMFVLPDNGLKIEILTYSTFFD